MESLQRKGEVDGVFRARNSALGHEARPVSGNGVVCRERERERVEKGMSEVGDYIWGGGGGQEIFLAYFPYFEKNKSILNKVTILSVRPLTHYLLNLYETWYIYHGT
jgi:hypothetical protein